MKISLITPAPKRSRAGNRTTAERWASLLRALGHRVRVAVEYDDEPADVMVALHAWRSAGAAMRFRELYPERKLIVGLALVLVMMATLSISGLGGLWSYRQAVRELALLVDQGLSQSDFDATREYLVNYSKLYVQTGSRRLGYAVDSAFYGTGFFVDEIRDRLSTMTVQDVNAAIRRHLQADNLGIAIVTREAEAFRDALLSGEPSDVTYNTEVAGDILNEDEEIRRYPLAINPDRVRVVPVEQMFVDVS